MFITFEGIEGSGKSTQRKRLLDWLDQEGITYISTREPGGTDVGQTLRDLLLSNSSSIASNRTELFLFAADRCEHLTQVVQPALDRGDWVVCDRYIDSTFAYQCGGREHPEQDILDIIRLTDAIEPDMTFLLDMSPEEGLRRARERADLDRFENEQMAFHERVRNAYLICAEKNAHRFCVIPSDDRSIDDIFDMIITKIKERRQLA
ncbi:dTMP kinase [Candidatus Marinamargulisbacteria bacterium SCGC AG-343-K17]|nr:dTMP kinase [Candidatus Marinamargulisbacteria bacterium SCGC AG-343-K17]